MSAQAIWSKEAEQAVLGGLLNDNSAIERVADLIEPASFWHGPHRTIYSAIASLVASRQPADPLTVHDSLRASGQEDEPGGLVYLNDLMTSVPGAANVRRYAEIVRDHATRRRLVEFLNSSIELARSGSGVDEVLGRIGEMLGPIQAGAIRRSPRPLREVVARVLEEAQSMSESGVEPGMRAGIPRLDSMLNGGLRPGKVYCIAARPGIGKSSLSQWIGMRLAHDGWPALFLSQEMEDADLAGRGVASLGQIDYGRIQTGRLDRDDWERLTDAAQKASRLGFYIDDQPALRPTDISIKASMVRGLKVLIVDYIQLTEAGSDRDTRNRQIEIVTRHLKRMAKEMGIAVIALSQLNRSIEQRANAQPVLSDLRESGAIEQDMDVVMFLWEVKQADVHGDSIIGCSVAKNRHGRRGRFALRFHGATQSWGESTYDLEAQASAAGSGRI